MKITDKRENQKKKTEKNKGGGGGGVGWGGSRDKNYSKRVTAK